MNTTLLKRKMVHKLMWYVMIKESGIDKVL